MARKMAKKILQKYKTNDPFEIADIYNIHVSNEPLPAHIGGFYTLIFDYAYIVINSNKTFEWQKAICAHELGHALLHNQDHAFLAMNDFVTQSKLEREANIFAATLLLDNEKPNEGESIFDFSRRMRIPVEFIKSLRKDELV